MEMAAEGMAMIENHKKKLRLFSEENLKTLPCPVKGV